VGQFIQPIISRFNKAAMKKATRFVNAIAMLLIALAIFIAVCKAL